MPHRIVDRLLEAPGDISPTVIGGQIDAADLVVRQHDDAADVEDVILATVFLVGQQRIRRGRTVGLHVLVKHEPIDVAQVADLIDLQNDATVETVEPPHHDYRGDSAKIAGADGEPERRDQRVLANPRITAKQERVVDFLLRALHAMGEELANVIEVVGVKLPTMIEPSFRFGRISPRGQRRRRLIKIERGRPFFCYPAVHHHQPVRDDLRFAGSPCHLLDGRVSRQP